MHQRPNGDHACASCKHQRKKCKEDCLMAPFFPVNLSSEFRSVHKTFGVSNVAKQLKKLENEEDRKSCTESMIWVANCFETDPVQGPFGEYQRVVAEYNRVREELNYLKSQDHQYYNRLTTAAATTRLPPSAAGPTNLFGYGNHPPSAGPVAVVMPNGQLANNGWNNNGCRAIVAGTTYHNHNNNINGGGLLGSVAGYHDNGSLRIDNHHHGGPINVQFPYTIDHNNNNGNGVVQDSDEVQNHSSGPQVINIPRRQQQPPPPPPPPLIGQNSQNMGNNEFQDQKVRPNGTLSLRQHHHQQQSYPMSSFSQQSFNGAGKFLLLKKQKN
ncbi:OLC1v1023826C2 [Oldenlandia corymbosa var. corymbosa]|uniref:OLC1v1023826C2 n=1 Tax=Oldenlandia corymbosa var. corymbosa TaxID=529605 RepID=A0AAV1C3W3_OLDCO|nr:OLC1v1023826C2 [Oldenlandia corymbosa var. corymbosa]